MENTVGMGGAGRGGTGEAARPSPRERPPVAPRTRPSNMSESSAEKIFAEMAESEIVALMAADINTVVSLLARRGMNTESPDDAAVTALLRSMYNMDNSIDISLEGTAANNLRALQMQAYDKWKNKAASTGIGGTAAATPTGDAEAQEAGKAVIQYNRLAKTTGLTLEPTDHLDYSLMAQMANLLDRMGRSTSESA